MGYTPSPLDVERIFMTPNIYLDNSNIWIEGKRVSAAQKGGLPTKKQKSLDDSYRLDFGHLIEIVCGYKVDLGKLMFYGSEPPPTDSVWRAAKTHGFQNKIFQRSKHNKEKMVDTQLTVDLITDIHTIFRPESDAIVIVAGDADYVPAIRTARDKGYFVKVAFWNHASGDIKKAASEFVNLDSHFNQLAYLR